MGYVRRPQVSGKKKSPPKGAVYSGAISKFIADNNDVGEAAGLVVITGNALNLTAHVDQVVKQNSGGKALDVIGAPEVHGWYVVVGSPPDLLIMGYIPAI